MARATLMNSYGLESLWTSIMPKSSFAKCQSDDEEILKLSLLLQATLELVSGIRQKELIVASHLKEVTKELKYATDRKELSESEAEALRKEILLLKAGLQTAETKAIKYQKEAEVSSAKYERIQSKVSSEVESRLREMFSNCLQQNKAATVLDMMTQMYQESQVPEAECPAVVRPVPARLAQVKFASVNQKAVMSSPEVIPSTPEERKTLRGGAFKSRGVKSESCQLAGLKSANGVPLSIPSSPDEIAGTPSPPSNIQKKDNRKRHENIMRVLHSHASAEDCEDEDINQTVVFAKNTEDMEESPTRPVRPALKENSKGPSIYASRSCDQDRVESISSDVYKKEKENDRNSSAVPNSQHQKKADLLLDKELPSTPIKTRDKSPILGNSGSKKNFSFSSNSSISSNSSTKTPSRMHAKSSFSRNSNKMASDDSSIAYHNKGHNKTKKSIQPSIKLAMNAAAMLRSSKTGRLSLNKSKIDISKNPEFNGGQRSTKELSIDTSHLSETEQLELALLESKKEMTHHSLLEDSDETIFLPHTSLLSKTKPHVNEARYRLPSNTCVEEAAAQESTPGTFFAPEYASTAKEETTPVKRKSPSSTHGIGKPLFASTEMDITDNSALHELTEYLDKKNFDKSALHPPDTSYDHLPKNINSPNYAYQGPAVRKKLERKKLVPLSCKQCGQFFDMVFGPDNQAEKKALIDDCTRHRGRCADVLTPQGYWDPDLPDTQYIREKQLMPTT